MAPKGSSTVDENGYWHMLPGSYQLRAKDASLAAVKEHISLVFLKTTDHSSEVVPAVRCVEADGEDEGTQEGGVEVNSEEDVTQACVFHGDGQRLILAPQPVAHLSKAKVACHNPAVARKTPHGGSGIPYPTPSIHERRQGTATQARQYRDGSDAVADVQQWLFAQ